MSPQRIVVCLGTDHHPFDRLVTWAAQLSRIDDADWFVQHGHTTLPPGLDGSPMLPVDRLHALFRDADAVVTHGGPGLIMEARAAGHLPIVVPRDPALGEHVDSHQQRFATHLSQAGLIAGVASRDQLRYALHDALDTGRTPVGVDSAGTPTGVALRFGELVDDLVSRRPTWRTRARAHRRIAS